MPPLLLAAARFTIAGAVLFVWAVAQGDRPPRRREWAPIAVLALLIFVVDYGILFWAEQRVPSGTAAVILATIPAFMALAEILILRTERLTLRLGWALLIGFAGVAVLVDPSLGMAGAPVYALGAAGLLVSAIAWSLASVLSKKLPMPSSKVMSAASQTLVGGLLLCIVAAAAGEGHGFRVAAVSNGAWLALGYLTVAGSIVGFTAYTWLIHHQSPTKVGTYAYINPVVAVVSDTSWVARCWISARRWALYWCWSAWSSLRHAAGPPGPAPRNFPADGKFKANAFPVRPRAPRRDRPQKTSRSPSDTKGGKLLHLGRGRPEIGVVVSPTG